MFLIDVNFVFAGLVTCGGDNQPPCTINSLFSNADGNPFWINLIEKVLGFSGVIILCIFVYSGIMIMIFGSDANKRKTYISAMKGSFIGILLVLFSFTIVKSVLMLLVGDKWSIYFGAERISCTTNESRSSSCNLHGTRMCGKDGYYIGCKCDPGWTGDVVCSKQTAPCSYDDYIWNDSETCHSNNKFNQTGTIKSGKACSIPSGGINLLGMGKGGACLYCSADKLNSSYCFGNGTRVCDTSKKIFKNECNCNSGFEGDRCNSAIISCVYDDYVWINSEVCHSSNKFNQTGTKIDGRICLDPSGGIGSLGMGKGGNCEYCSADQPNSSDCNSHGTRKCDISKNIFKNECACNKDYRKDDRCSQGCLRNEDCSNGRCNLKTEHPDDLKTCAPNKLIFDGVSSILNKGSAIGSITEGMVCGSGGKCAFVKQDYIDEAYYLVDWGLTDGNKCDGRGPSDGTGNVVGLSGAYSYKTHCFQSSGSYYCLRCVKNTPYNEIK